MQVVGKKQKNTEKKTKNIKQLKIKNDVLEYLKKSRIYEEKTG